MKQEFIRHTNTTRLILFFTGWAFDAVPFRNCASEHDLLICYDYRSLSFDMSKLSSYSEVKVVGWSFGVSAASRIIPQLANRVVETVAISGTMTPINDSTGIPTRIFSQTLEHLDDQGLMKFYRRICADSASFDSLMADRPGRPIEQLAEELRAEQLRGDEAAILPSNIWDRAYIAGKDRIFPPANQRRAWHSASRTVIDTPAAHYDPQLIADVLHD